MSVEWNPIIHMFGVAPAEDLHRFLVDDPVRANQLPLPYEYVIMRPLHNVIRIGGVDPYACQALHQATELMLRIERAMLPESSNSSDSEGEAMLPDGGESSDSEEDTVLPEIG